MSLGEHLIYATARVAMLLYFATLFVRLGVTDAARCKIWSRRLWTLGCLCYLLHVAAAFHFAHHWSHTAAAESTSRRTAEMIGRPAPAGIYFNYLFTLAWTVDVARQWLAAASYDANFRAVTAICRGFTFFMVFNAVVVFGHGPTRWVGTAACVALAATMAFRSRRSSIA